MSGQALVARELKRYRERAGLSQNKLAKLTGYSRTYIWACEKPGATLVSEEVVKRMDEVLCAGGALVDLRARAHAEHIARRAPSQCVSLDATQERLGPNSRGEPDVQPSVTIIRNTRDADHVEACRRELLDALYSGSSVANVEVWEQLALDHAISAKDRVAALLLGDLTADLRDLQQVLERCHSASALRRLTRVAAQLAGLTCLTLIKLDDRAAFRRWARTARTLAAEVEEPETSAWVLAQEAYGHYYSHDLISAIAVARSAQDTAPRPCAGSALAAALEARAHAALGRPNDTHAALRTAEEVLASVGTDGTTSAFGYDEAQLRFHQSNALTHLGDTKAAWRVQDQALEIIAPEDFMDRAFTQLDRAMCLSRDGDPTASAAHAVVTLLQLSEEQRRGIIAARAHQILDSLPVDNLGHRSGRELRELLDSTNQGGGRT